MKPYFSQELREGHAVHRQEEKTIYQSIAASFSGVKL